MNIRPSMLVLSLCNFVFAADDSRDDGWITVISDEGKLPEMRCPNWIKKLDANNEYVVAVCDNPRMNRIGYHEESIKAFNLKTGRQTDVKDFAHIDSLSLSADNTLAVLTSYANVKKIDFVKANADGIWSDDPISWRCGPKLSDRDDEDADHTGVLSRFSQNRVAELYKASDGTTKISSYCKPWQAQFPLGTRWPFGSIQLQRHDLMIFPEGQQPPTCCAGTSEGEVAIAQKSGDIEIYDSALNPVNEQRISTRNVITGLAATRNWLAACYKYGDVVRWDRRNLKPEVITSQQFCSSVAILDDGTVVTAKEDKILLWPVVAQTKESDGQ